MTEPGVLLDDLRALVGTTSIPRAAVDAVNETMIRHWAEVFGDANPCYVDADFAARSIHGGIVAPPTMVDVWGKPGLTRHWAADNPLVQALARLDAGGFTSIMAVNSELELARPLRLGEVVESSVTLTDVSDEKQTAVGVGHFVTVANTYAVAGETVGQVLFRVLKFRPGTGRPRKEAYGPDPDPAKRPRPAMNQDHQGFWDAARRHELVIPTCHACGTRYFPATPRCWHCGSFDMGWTGASGRGRLYSFAVPHHPQTNGFRYPILVGLVELDEGVRLVSNIVGCRRDDLAIGMPLEVCWLDSHPPLVEGDDGVLGPITLPQFRPAPPPRRVDTRTASDVAVGERLPLTPIPITATLIVGGALATRDYEDVHHDRDIAVRRGAADIFMNIHTSVGLAQRWLTDWTGPEAVLRALRVRLGAPNHPGDTMTFAGDVAAADSASGRITVSFQGFNGLGDHIVGTADLTLPTGRPAEAVR
jgi:uncharacterized protein